MWNLKKGHNELLCRTDTDSQTLKNLCFPNETGWGVGDALGLWDGNAVKLGYTIHNSEDMETTQMSIDR